MSTVRIVESSLHVEKGRKTAASSMARKMNARPRECTAGFQCWRLIWDLPNQRNMTQYACAVVSVKKNPSASTSGAYQQSTRFFTRTCSYPPVDCRLYFNGCSINHFETRDRQLATGAAKTKSHIEFHPHRNVPSVIAGTWPQPKRQKRS